MQVEHPLPSTTRDTRYAICDTPYATRDTRYATRDTRYAIRHTPYPLILPLAFLLLVTLTLAAALGAVYVPPGHILGILSRQITGSDLGLNFSVGEQAIILSLRLPRALAAALVGMALAGSGVLFQGLLRNPMADPYIIGTSGGAALGATIAMLLPVTLAGARFGLIPVFAFIGALITVLIVYRLALVGGQAPITTLLLAGFAVSSLLAAVMSFLMLMSGRNIPNILIWLMGGVSTSGWNALAVVTPMVLAGLAASFFFTADLNALLLGEEAAAYLGVSVERRKLGLLALGSFLAATAVSISGLVGFVGLVIPHIARLILGPEHRRLLPAAALLGGSFMALADLLARVLLAPTELPVGMITAAIGAPFFLYLLKKSKTPYTF